MCPIDGEDQTLVLPPHSMPCARTECCTNYGGDVLDEKLGSENDCNHCRVIHPVDNSTASYDYVAAVDDNTGLANSAFDLDDASWDSELEVSDRRPGR